MVGLTKSLNETVELVKNTFVVVRRNPSILKPTIAQFVIGIILWVFAIASIPSIFIFQNVILAIIAIITFFISIFLILLFPYVKMYYRAAQSWIVYHTFKGENISYKEGLSRARKNLLDIFLLSSLELVFGALSRKLKAGTAQKDSLWTLLNLLLIISGAVIEEGWDLIGNYLLPGSIIPEKNLGEALSDINDIKENVPSALVGVFGIDFIGNAVKGYMTFIVIIGVLLAIVAFFITENLLLLGTIFIILLLAIIASFFGRIAIDMVKTIYFTIFYAVLTAPDEIPDDMMEEATHYLNKEHLEHS